MVSMDGAMTKAPLGGEKNWANRRIAASGVNRSVLTEANGAPMCLTSLGQAQ